MTATDHRVIPTIMILGTPLLPESPRWLIETNKIDKAVDSVRRLRVAGFDAEREVNDICAAMKHHEDIAGGSSYLDLFKTKSGNLRRTLIVLSMGCLQQGQGSGLLMCKCRGPNNKLTAQSRLLTTTSSSRSWR